MSPTHTPLLSRLQSEAWRTAAFIVLFTCDAVSRAMLLSVVPLQAYELLGEARTVSLVYFFVAFTGLFTILVIPTVLRGLSRRVATCLALSAQIGSVALLASHSTTGLVCGLILQALAYASMDVMLSLYMLDHIPRRELNLFEPKRMMIAGGSYAISPWIGVALHQNVGEWTTYAVAAMASLTLMAVFLAMQLQTSPSMALNTATGTNPVRLAGRFISQPRLLLSWILAFGRNGWWLIFFIYIPIYITSVGYSPAVGGALVTIGMLPLILTPQWSKLGRRFGIRNLLSLGYGMAGIGSISAAIAASYDMPQTSIGLFCVAALFACTVDGAGNVPFLRAVRHYDRTAMTSIFMTFRHISPIVFPGIMAFVLSFLPLPFVFVTSGVLTLTMAVFSRFLPRSL